MTPLRPVTSVKYRTLALTDRGRFVTDHLTPDGGYQPLRRVVVRCLRCRYADDDRPRLVADCICWDEWFRDRP